MNNTIILCASPKKEGNCAQIAKQLHTCLSFSSVLFLSDFKIEGCIDCSFCMKNSGQCQLDIKDNKDNAKELFTHLLQAENIFIVSPIYFYHIPSQLKAFIDRGQRFWANAHDKQNINQKKVYAIYSCARDKGEKLPQGIDLTLKYFAPLIKANFEKSLCLYGLDKSDDYLNSQKSQGKVQEFLDSIELNKAI